MLFTQIDWPQALGASALLLFGAVFAANMAGRAAQESGLGRLAALGVGGTGLGAMIWTATIALDRLGAAPVDAVGALAAAAAVAFLVLYLTVQALDARMRRDRRAAAAALIALGVLALLALAALAAEKGPATMLRLALAAHAATLGVRLAYRRKRLSHSAIAVIGLVACVFFEPAQTTSPPPLHDVSAIETNSITPPGAPENGLVAAAFAVGLLTLFFGASFLVGAAPRRVAMTAAAPAAASALSRSNLSGRGAAAADPEERLADALGRALDREDIDLDVQPQRRFADGALVGGETLARWRRGPDAGARPDQFVAAAEKYGRIDALGAYVLRRSCRLAAGWPQSLHVAVNVSPLQLQNPAFEEMVAQTLEETGLSPRRLELELTESAFSDTDAFDARMIDRLRARGLSISIDDFGRGQSSLSRLQSLRVDQIKLDRSLVSEVETSEAARTIVRSVVDLASRLGVQTLAEGVETLEQLAFHKSVGCDVVQGYLIGRPMSADAFPHDAPAWPL